MVKDMLTFLVIWIFVLIFFLCVGMLIFIDTTEFKTFKSAFLYLAQAAIGSYDTTIFERIYQTIPCLCDNTCPEYKGQIPCQEY